jgi:hypothetical protein
MKQNSELRDLCCLCGESFLEIEFHLSVRNLKIATSESLRRLRQVVIHRSQTRKNLIESNAENSAQQSYNA